MILRNQLSEDIFIEQLDTTYIIAFIGDIHI